MREVIFSQLLVFELSALGILNIFVFLMWVKWGDRGKQEYRTIRLVKNSVLDFFMDSQVNCYTLPLMSFFEKVPQKREKETSERYIHFYECCHKTISLSVIKLYSGIYL